MSIDKTVNIIDKIIHNHDPICILRGFRNLMVSTHKEHKNEIAIMQNVIKEFSKKEDKILEFVSSEIKKDSKLYLLNQKEYFII